jgi:uncharacterized protein (TIGR00255 family)
MTTTSPALSSMTGFASLAREVGPLHINIELRAVNHRYLDLQFRLPDEFRHAESALREPLAGRVHRGKVECRVQLQRNEAATVAGSLSTEALERLLAAQGAVLARAPDARPLSVHETLRWPGVIAESLVPPDTLTAELLGMMNHVVGEFLATRAREGERLKTMLLERCTRIRDLATHIAPKMPALQKAYEIKLAERMREAGVAADPERLAQELALFASKIDVAEELSRLVAHVAEVERVLGAGGACGKRLDFLMQELNREANTLGSKSVDTELTRVAVELKVAIEQMREQVQNIE